MINLSEFLVTLEGMLRTRSYEKNYTEVPYKAYPASIKGCVDLLADKFKIKKENLDGLFLVKATDGVMDRLILPTIFAPPEDPKILETFDQVIGEEKGNGYLKLNQKVVIAVDSITDVKGVEIGLEARENQSPVLSVYFPPDHVKYFPSLDSDTDADDLDSLFEFPIYLKDLKKQFKTFELGKKYENKKLKAIMSPMTNGSSAMKITELEEESVHTITGFEKRIHDEYGVLYTLIREDGQKIFTNSAVNSVLSANPLISAEKPATLTLGKLTETKNNRKKIAAVLQVSGGFQNTEAMDMDW